MKAKIELSNIESVKRFTDIVSEAEWCVCEKDIYSAISEFVVT